MIQGDDSYSSPAYKVGLAAGLDGEMITFCRKSLLPYGSGPYSPVRLIRLSLQSREIDSCVVTASRVYVSIRLHIPAQPGLFVLHVSKSYHLRLFVLCSVVVDQLSGRGRTDRVHRLVLQDADQWVSKAQCGKVRLERFYQPGAHR